jgi:hypothetical protein
MKKYLQPLSKISRSPLALASMLAATSLGMAGADGPAIESTTVTVTADATAGGEDVVRPDKKHVITKSIVLSNETNDPARKDRPWLGISTEEAPEVLTSQLGLEPGVGLVVTYVATNSPAAKVGLKKNDVLAELDGQPLVLPAQLRKLVQSRKEGDTVKLTYFRSGKKDSVSATLEKTSAKFSWLEEQKNLQGDLRELQLQLRELPIKDAVRQEMKTLRDSLGHLKIDQQKVQEEVQRSMDQAKQAYEEALRNAPKAEAQLDAVRKALEDAFKSRIKMNHDAAVTVRSSSDSVKSIVKADDSGTLVIVNRPKLHLTAHDKDGKLVFDGEIQTPEDRAKVPRELWSKVEPLLDKIDPDVEKSPDAHPAPPKETSSLPKDGLDQESL